MTNTDQGTAIPPRIAERPRSGSAIDVWSFTDVGGMRRSSVGELTTGLLKAGEVSWVDVTDGDATTLEALVHDLHLTAPVARVARPAGPRPTLAPLADHTRVTILVPALEQRALVPIEVVLIVTDRFLISGHGPPLPFRDRIEARAAQHPHLIAGDSAFLLSILLDEWLREVESVTEELDEWIEDMEERAIGDTSRSFLDDLVDLKELAFDVFQLVDRHHAVFDATLNPDVPFVSSEAVESHFRDLSRRFERRVVELRNGRGAINNAVNIFSSSMAHRTNRIITLLTIISTVLMPMTVIFSFFGTNFDDLPLFTNRMFVVMWALVATTTAVIGMVLARRGWARPT